MTFETWFAERFSTIPLKSAHAVLELSGEGATIPFIARYRKEKTGNLDEVAIQTVVDAKENWDDLIKRQKFIVDEIGKQGKLTDELKTLILGTFSSEILEDLYLPFKQKRRTKAQLAREAGIEPLADWIWNVGNGVEQPLPGQTLDIWAFTFRNEDKGFKDSASTIDGAVDILVERLSEKLELRQFVRDEIFQKGHAVTGKATKAKAASKYENYFAHSESIQSLLKPENSHRYLAMRRGWIEEELTLTLGGPPTDPDFETKLLQRFEAAACSQPDSITAPVLQKTARLALKAHVLPSIENEAHKALREAADGVAIEVFALNVRKLLMAAPYGAKAVLGVDPGIRTGCKVAIVDHTGRFLADSVWYLNTEEGKKQVKALLPVILDTGHIRAIAVGNGTAGRETEIFLRQALKEASLNVPVVMVNEAGASVYSASETAREEFPDLDLTVRGAISIARRLQDPLAELVKVDPKAIGVGQYQHDVSQPALKKCLESVVDSCVNSVGVNLNTASHWLLARVAGIGPALAQAIVQYRQNQGLFKNREALRAVPRLSDKTFEQCAGFLRVQDGDQPLDNTGVHPERYSVIMNYAAKLGKTVSDLMGSGVAALKTDQGFKAAVGEFTAADIIQDLEKPGRDPRDEFVPFEFRADIFELKDVKAGMICPGIVTNVTNFGAFVDIGVHQDGLVHISQLSDKFVKDPKEVVSPGDRVQVRVIEINLEKTQLSLSMKKSKEESEQARPSRAERGDRDGQRADRGPRSGDGHKRDNRRPPARTSGKPAPGKPAGPPSPKAQPKTARPAAPAFNNPFGSLASMKKELKPK